MLSEGQGTRGPTRHIRPGDRPTKSSKEIVTYAASTSPSSSQSDCGKGVFRIPTDNRFHELERKMCSVTGIFREISADYHISSTVLGEGHYGVVRRCRHRATRRVFAVKSVNKSKLRRMDHLRRELYLLHNINHRGIMKLVDFYEDAKSVHIVTDLYTGGELFDQICKHATPYGCFSERRSASIIRSLLEAVAYLHDNDIVHRDITPGNILFESPRDGARIRLVDFGLSRKHKKGEKPMDNPAGTAYFMAPELLNRQYDRSCDVWSVGTIAYVLLCGYPPFNGKTEPEIFECIKKGKFSFPATAWSSKSDDAKDFINCLLRMDPGRRPTAREALSHPWLKRNASDDAKFNRARQHGDLVVGIKSLRKAISKFKRCF